MKKVIVGILSLVILFASQGVFACVNSYCTTDPVYPNPCPGYNYGNSCNYPPVSYCKINNFSASDTSIEEGDYTVLSWNTSNCYSLRISNLDSVNNSGNAKVYPSSDTTYVLTGYNKNGSAVTGTVRVYVDENNNDNNDNECYISNFSASDTSIEEGDSTTLKWNTNNCESVKISSIGSVDDDGSEKVYPTSDKTYTLTAYDEDGSSETDTVKIYVDEDTNDNECTIDSFTASDVYLSSGDSVTFKWKTTDCDDVSMTNVGDVDDDGSEKVYPNSTTTYTLRASGDEGSDSQSIKVYVDYTSTTVSNTNVVTTVATNISQTGAQLNGLVTSSKYSNANVRFEYGTTINLGGITTSKSTNGNTTFSDYLTNLSPNTIYYFRAVAENSSGVSRGAIEVFKTTKSVTTGTTTVRPVVQGTTVSASESPVMLTIENKYQTIGVGDIVDYVVYYKNISKSVLDEPMIQVYLPAGITVTNASIGTYSEDNKTLSAPLEDLNPGEEGVIYVQAEVTSLDSNLAQIVTTTALIYTNDDGAQENAMAYVLNNPKVDSGSVLGASAFFGNPSMGLIGWLLVTIFILVVILIVRSFYSRRVVINTVSHK
jgi:hypothetical protein